MTETSSQKALGKGALESDDERTLKWAETLHHAQTRSQMFIGDPDTAHRHLFSSLFRLVWQARVFRQPGRVRIDLSPHQCVFRCDAKPLIRPVQEIYSFPGGQVLGEAWAEENRAYFERLNAEDEARSLTWSQQRSRRGWWYCFSGPRVPQKENMAFLAGLLMAHTAQAEPFIAGFCRTATDVLWLAVALSGRERDVAAPTKLHLLPPGASAAAGAAGEPDRGYAALERTLDTAGRETARGRV